MSQVKVIIAHLRRPRQDANEMRTDPFWEFGSFGCTGCHRHNLMNPRKLHELKEARFAFAQGGNEGTRLVYLTSPLAIWDHGDFGEVKWEPITMPFRYLEAPLLIDVYGHSDFPLLREFIRKTGRSSWVARFSSRFRSRRMPLDNELAQEMIGIFVQCVLRAPSDSFAVTYVDALPYAPPKIDQNRTETYKNLARPNAYQVD